MVLTMAETDPMYKRLLGQADRNRASTSSISCESVTVGIVNQPHRVKLRLTGQAVHGATFAQQAAKPRTTDNVLIFIFVFRKKFKSHPMRDVWIEITTFRVENIGKSLVEIQGFFVGQPLQKTQQFKRHDARSFNAR